MRFSDPKFLPQKKVTQTISDRSYKSTSPRHKTDIINCHLIATRGVGVCDKKEGWREDNYCNARGPKPQNQPAQGLID